LKKKTELERASDFLEIFMGGKGMGLKKHNSTPEREIPKAPEASIERKTDHSPKLQ